MRFEILENRAVPSASPFANFINPYVERENNDTVELARVNNPLPTWNGTDQIQLQGNLERADDIDWFTFELTSATSVQIYTVNFLGKSPLLNVLGLYQQTPGDYTDPTNPSNIRLLSQDDSGLHGGDAWIGRTLQPGSYALALSGARNAYFHPDLAGSGGTGPVGAYGVVVEGEKIAGPFSGQGPGILFVETQNRTSQTWNLTDLPELGSSPQALRVVTSGYPLAANSVRPGKNVLLQYCAEPEFTSPTDVAFRVSTFGPHRELRLFPTRPLGPGFYRIVLVGNRTEAGGSPLVADPASLLGGFDNPNQVYLGMNRFHPDGQTFTFSFSIVDNEGSFREDDLPNDTQGGATSVGTLEPLAVVQLEGMIGDDAFLPQAPANDVDFYRFTIKGDGLFALSAEVFAGRIGSSLDAGVSLYRWDEIQSTLIFVAGNEDTKNPTAIGRNGSQPLSTDPTLFAGLKAGEYILAVSATGNTPDPTLDRISSRDVFDPNVSRSGVNGTTTGPYVLSFFIYEDSISPSVVAAPWTAGQVLPEAPTTFTLRFSEPVNLPSLTYAVDEFGEPLELQGIYFLQQNGTRIYPRLLSFDFEANTAQFMLLDRLANGKTELHVGGHLSRLSEITDLAGNALTANHKSGDFVVPFEIAAPAPRTENGSVVNEPYAPIQDLGTLFPREMSGSRSVAFECRAGDVGTETHHDFQFSVIQDRVYFFNLKESDFARFQLLGEKGVIDLTTVGVPFVQLKPGRYTIRFFGWSLAEAPFVGYRLEMTASSAQENPVPLASRPVPAFRIRFDLHTTIANPPASDDGETLLRRPETPTSRQPGTPLTPTNPAIPDANDPVEPGTASPLSGAPITFYIPGSSSGIAPAANQSAGGNSALNSLLPNSLQNLSASTQGGARSEDLGQSPQVRLDLSLAGSETDPEELRILPLRGRFLPWIIGVSPHTVRDWMSLLVRQIVNLQNALQPVPSEENAEEEDFEEMELELGQLRAPLGVDDVRRNEVDQVEASSAWALLFLAGLKPRPRGKEEIRNHRKRRSPEIWRPL